jgi:AmiR/NasT family two-component response regulator
MKALGVALLQSDSRIARGLAASLCHHFQIIHVTHSMGELREIIVQHRTELVILDLEMASMSEIERLHREFTGVCIVCTHRLADEEMWTAALNAGASDVCPAFDTRTIVAAALHSAPMAGPMAA